MARLEGYVSLLTRHGVGVGPDVAGFRLSWNRNCAVSASSAANSSSSLAASAFCSALACVGIGCKFCSRARDAEAARGVVLWEVGLDGDWPEEAGDGLAALRDDDRKAGWLVTAQSCKIKLNYYQLNYFEGTICFTNYIRKIEKPGAWSCPRSKVCRSKFLKNQIK